jgi:hypothetical protein
VAQLTRKENESFDRASPSHSYPIAELTHSMQSLNTSVSFKCKIRLSLWDVEERKSCHPSARFRKGAGSATKKNRKSEGHFRHAKSKNEVGRENIVERDRGLGCRAGGNLSSRDRGMPLLD